LAQKPEEMRLQLQITPLLSFANECCATVNEYVWSLPACTEQEKWTELKTRIVHIAKWTENCLET